MRNFIIKKADYKNYNTIVDKKKYLLYNNFEQTVLIIIQIVLDFKNIFKKKAINNIL